MRKLGPHGSGEGQLSSPHGAAVDAAADMVAAGDSGAKGPAAPSRAEFTPRGREIGAPRGGEIGAPGAERDELREVER